MADARHLTDTQWERLACSEMTDAERASALEHVTACPPCARICRGLLAFEEEARRFDPGVPARGLSARPSPVAAWSWARTGLAALAAASAWLALAPVRPPTPAVDVVRAGPGAASPGLVSPVGVLAGTPSEFRWNPCRGAISYRVELFDAAGESVWSGDAGRSTSLGWPAGVRPAPGRYYWHVVACTGRGDADTAVSPLADFEIR